MSAIGPGKTLGSICNSHLLPHDGAGSSTPGEGADGKGPHRNRKSSGSNLDYFVYGADL
jgi:hypothetical protein